MLKMDNPKYCKYVADIPATKHWAVIRFSTIYIEGDERSKKFPGHGYPAQYKPVTEYLAFDDLEKLREYVKLQGSDKIQVLEVKPLQVVKEVSIKVI